MKKYFYAILAAAAVISACAKVDVPEDTKIPVDAAKAAFSGTIIQPNGLANTKVYARDGKDEQGNDVENLYWNKNDEILVSPTGTSDYRYFLADSDGANVFFGFNEDRDGHSLETISSWLIDNDHNGYKAYYPVKYWGDNFYDDKWFNLYLDGEDASLVKMPLKAELDPVSTPGHMNRKLYFSSPFAILKIVMPIGLKVDAMEVTAESDVTVDDYTVSITSVTALRQKALTADPNSKTYAIYVPIKPTTTEWGFKNAQQQSCGYNSLTFVASKGGEPVAEMSTYENIEDDIYVEANNIYYFDFRKTLTVNAGTTEYDLSVADSTVNYLVNVPADMETLKLNATTEKSAPAAIFVNVRENTVTNLIINAPYSHVEVFNGEATEVTSKTSNSTFVAKSDFTVQTLTVKKGNVVVEGTKVDDYSTNANVKKIIIPNDAEGQIVIDVKGVDPSNELDNKRVQIDNQRDNGTVIMVVGERISNPGFDKVPGSKDVQQVAGAVAKIGDAEYYTLASAIEGVKDGETIKLVRDVDQAFGISVPAGNKTFTVDFGGHTYKVEKPGAGSANTKTQAFQLNKGNTITFKNGRIECTAANKDFTWQSGDAIKGVAMIIQNYCDLTLDGMTIDATNIAHNGNNANVRYAVSTNHGSTEFKGNTTIITVGNDIAFDSCDSQDPVNEASYPGKPTVIWNSTGSINGGIELTGGDFVLGHNLEVKQPIRVKAASVLDLGSYTLSASSDFTKKGRGVVIVNRGGDLTVNGTTGVIDGSATTVNAAVVLTEPETCDTAVENLKKAAKLTVNGGTLQGHYFGISGNGSRGNTEVIINGGTIKGTKTDDSAGIYNPQAGSLTINGGVIEGAVGIYVKAGVVTTSTTGGTINGVGAKADFTHNESGINNTGDAFVVENCGYPGGTPNVTISGGSFVSTNAAAVASYAYGAGNEPITGFITGGTFNTNPSAEYVKEGYSATQSGSNWKVSQIN